MPLDPNVFSPAWNAAALALPLCGSRVQAGFPSPADDYVETPLDLHEFLIERPAATFFLRVRGDSMVGDGIYPGDILVVDRSVEASHDKIVIASVDNELTVKRLYSRSGRIALLAANPAYPPIEIQEGRELAIWGVMIGLVRRV